MSSPGNELTERQYEDIVAFRALVEQWDRRIRLVASSVSRGQVTRLIGDAVTLSQCAPKAGAWCDLGSGNGFPGVVLAIMGRGRISLSLVESDRRKAEFLRAARRMLKLDYAVEPRRIETLAPLNADVVTAQALAPLPKLLSYYSRHGKGKGLGLFPKGRTWQVEVDSALKTWSFDYEAITSTSQVGSVILKVWDVKPLPPTG